MTSILFEVLNDGIGVITMNRPEARNALTWEAMESFSQAIDGAHAVESSLRALVVTGAEGAFCAGGDLFELDGYPTRLDGARLADIMGEALERLEALPIPTVAAMEGPALGGGAEVALACDIRVMAEGATIGMMHVRLGICPAWGGGQRLLRLVGYSRALEWLAAGRVFTASEALTYGLTNQIAPEGTAMDAAMALAETIVRQDPQAVRAIKRLARAGIELRPGQAAAAERAEFPDLWAAPAHLEASARFVARKNHRPV
ncbi:MAG TPA: enoyl-CoA hydratase/isomerase family protein [Anaerolineales bacterium]|nr:enoyl-CoA hydratase/isomerase family protein [Anaerolineales bacterium]